MFHSAPQGTSPPSPGKPPPALLRPFARTSASRIILRSTSAHSVSVSRSSMFAGAAGALSMASVEESNPAVFASVM